MKWEILGKGKIKNSNDIVTILLKNRGITKDKEQKEFFNPKDPSKISLKELDINEVEVKKAVKRIKASIKSKEKVFVYGDYDCDGICATAIMWEALHDLRINVLPYIPDRFSEGYGLNIESIKKLKEDNPDLGLIVTVDHGIVADKKVDIATELGIDIIITDHHQLGKTKPKAFATIHTTKISGSGVSFVVSRELGNESGLELAALGTIADQLPLTGINRSIVKYGLKQLNETKRVGLLSLFQSSGIQKGNIGTYEVGFVIAPRINAMGRLGHAIDSLRILCTKSREKAAELSTLLSKTNLERQKIVEEVILHARASVTDEKIIVLSHESYHEGVIGLAAGRITEEFYRPAIVLSKKGDISKASARSISGFNIIEAIRKLDNLIIEGGGHSMAAGFSIKTSLIDKFKKEINKIAKEFLNEDILLRKIKIDLEINFNLITLDFLRKLEEFSPTGYGNPNPTFITRRVEVLDTKIIGQTAKHLKLRLRQGGQVFGSIYFGGGKSYSELTPDTKIDIVYQVEENTWNGYTNIQLKIKDLKAV